MNNCIAQRGKNIKKQDGLIMNFHKGVGKGPVHKCCVHDQLWYRHSVVIVQRNSLPDRDAVDMCVCLI